MNSPGAKRNDTIPSVDFYGEDDAWPTSELLHSELLVDRSAQHNWVIRAHRHSNQAQIFLLREGSGVACLDSIRHEAVAPGVIVIPERCVHEFEWSSDCEGYVLSIASSLIGRLKRKSGHISDVFTRPAVYSLDEDGMALGSTMDRIHNEYGKDNPLRELALEAQLIEIAVCLARMLKADTETVARTGRGVRHYQRFLELVEQRHKTQWSVARYAGALGITAPHLNAICKKYDGRSAKRVLHDRLILAAIRGLSYTDNSIAGVARSLGFADPSYFARFFKRSEGLTPSLFRRQSGTQSVWREDTTARKPDGPHDPGCIVPG